jgi:hypothetical protein
MAKLSQKIRFFCSPETPINIRYSEYSEPFRPFLSVCKYPEDLPIYGGEYSTILCAVPIDYAAKNLENIKPFLPELIKWESLQNWEVGQLMGGN